MPKLDQAQIQAKARDMLSALAGHSSIQVTQR